jgi:hypothetical protein
MTEPPCQRPPLADLDVYEQALAECGCDPEVCCNSWGCRGVEPLVAEVNRLRAENEELRQQVKSLAGCAYCGEPETTGDDAFCSAACKEKDERLRAKWAREANR